VAARNEIESDAFIKRRWPCELAIRALTYAGWSFERVKGFLESWGLPAPKSLLKPIYNSMLADLQAYNPSMVFTQQQLQDNGIKELYNWAISESDEDPVCAEDSILVMSTAGIMSQRLTTMVCVMLYYMWGEEQIAEAINKSTKRPPRIWNASQINFYRRYFWDPYSMYESDWQAYFQLSHYAPTMANCFHVLHSKPMDQAFSHIGIIMGAQETTMIDYMIQLMYTEGVKEIESGVRHVNESGMRKCALAAKMINDKKHTSEDTSEAARALKNIRELLIPAEAAGIVTIGSIEGEVSDFESMRQLRGVVEAEKDKFASYKG